MNGKKGESKDPDIFCAADIGDGIKYQERENIGKDLHHKIILGKQGKIAETEIEGTLWQTIIAYQNYPFHTTSGLPFSYVVKKNKTGAYSGELIINRKETSKTLTKSSVMLAFHRVLGEMKIMEGGEDLCIVSPTLVPPKYKGPKAIGQIFGISYVYSIFWKIGLIEVPETAADKLKGKMKEQ